MKRSFPSFVSLVAVVTLLAAACGGGDKKPAATAAAPTEQPTAASTARAASKTPAAAKTSSSTSATKDEKAVGGLFNSLFNGALSGGAGGGAASLGEGDPTLAKYLPSNDDLPPGYTPQGQYTFRAPDGISETGGMDIAAEMAATGDVSASQPDFSKMGILMAMVIKPDDLQSLGEAFDSVRSLDTQELQDALTQGTGDAGIFTIKDVKVLDAKGLGEGNVGFQMTIDLGGLASMFEGLARRSTRRRSRERRTSRSW